MLELLRLERIVDRIIWILGTLNRLHLSTSLSAPEDHM